MDVGNTRLVEESGSGNRDDEDNAQIWYLQSSAQFVKKNLAVFTSSPNLAIAGSRVGEASRWRSIPSKTNMDFFTEASKCWSCTTKALILSHLPSTTGGLSFSSLPPFRAS